MGGIHGWVGVGTWMGGFRYMDGWVHGWMGGCRCMVGWI